MFLLAFGASAERCTQICNAGGVRETDVRRGSGDARIAQSVSC